MRLRVKDINTVRYTKMNYLALILRVCCLWAFYFLYSCSSHKSKNEVKSRALEIGHPLPEDCIVLNDSNYLVLTSPSNLTFGKKVQYLNAEYSLTLDADKKINFISTNDTSITVCDIYKPGMKYGDISTVSRLSNYNLSGWAYVVEIKGCNWKLGLHLDSNRIITDTSRVGFIFKN